VTLSPLAGARLSTAHLTLLGTSTSRMSSPPRPLPRGKRKRGCDLGQSGRRGSATACSTASNPSDDAHLTTTRDTKSAELACSPQSQKAFARAFQWLTWSDAS
jgi:hypothetical protein